MNSEINLLNYESTAMKKLLLTLSFLSICLVVNAQFGGFGNSKPKIKGKISGVVIDSLGNVPVGFATISMRKAGRKKIINGTLSEDDGSFAFTDVAPGKYDLEFSFIGYSVKIVSEVETTKKKPDNNIGNIFLVPTDYLLDEVEVTAQRALIENKVDKIVFNAEDDASIAGGDATEVLRKVPLLSVDLDGNVSLRGSQNVQILINGKPSGMFSTNVGDALKMFPADQIKKVEVISSPGAKYDGEGSGGIVNIITKKDNVEGVAGTINASAGNRQSNANLTLNIGKGRFGFTTNGSVFYSHPVDASNSFSNITEAGEVLYALDGTTNTSRLGFNGSANAFYDFNAYNSINSSLTFRGFGFDQESTAAGNLAGNLFDRISTGDNLFSGYDWNLDYTKKFESNETRELTFAGQISANIQNQDNVVTDDFVGGNGFSRDDDISNEGDNVEITAQVDYVEPFSNGSKLEVGAKTVIRNIDSDSRFLPDLGRSNIFLYDQNVYAGYASYNFVVGKLNFVTGMRYEHTDIKGDGRESVQQFSNGYDNWLPNIAVSRSFKNFRTLKLAYSQRIQRPNLYYINPFRNITDLGNIREGNPTLNPELVRQIEVGYNTNILGFSIFSTAYYKKSTELIESVSTLVTPGELGLPANELNNITLTTFQNVGENNSFGINFFTSKSIGKLTVRGGGDVYSYNASGIIDGQAVENSALSYRLFTNGDFSFKGNFKADFFGFFQAPRFTLQGENPSFSIFGIGFRKDMKDWSVGIRIIEPFAKNKSFDSDIQGDGFRQVSSFTLPFQSFGLNIRYKFGKVDFKERKSKVKNTDLKDGGGDQQGQGGGNRIGG